MTIYTTFDFYFNKYLCGRQVVVESTAFDFYVREASAIIKKYTFDNIDDSQPIPEEVQLCCCELAEKIYIREKQRNANSGVASESVGGWSKSYESSEAQEKQFKDDIKNIVHKWLSSTDLLYRGIS